ncbi:uracil-DNA glycosylase [candidate division WS6 bacterium RIFOXYC1_FULL_33_9]|nr:uracil-DNA glycosylase [Candidatus Woesearchaeota archaeon]OGC36181.1 MAG: uracil-DNA glycosylase [candidate division WS6 bacterium RIFOXYB1_FULL_33_15]OGC37605.1 MAG: uracil-DNA glycosylase [candidate division WS6 bacterium RIFOXYC1_FULL_33_9]HBB64435.1 uracil-DNA glycosylase [Patescibacteria group bacterium]
MIKELEKKAYSNPNTLPPRALLLNALELTPIEKTKVVILGQDPYHGQGEANGLAFSVNKDIRIPPSLRNIFIELHNDLGLEIPKYGDLTSWAKQGVLLLNSVLTVEKDKPGSHRYIGWEKYTDSLISEISEKKEHVVFILWGKYAQSKVSLIDNSKHLILQSPHPSPFSARKGFFNSKPFSKCNTWLKEKNIKEIDWELTT